MPNGELTEEEVKIYDKPLREIEYIFKLFAKKYGFHFNHTTYHEWPSMYMIRVNKSSRENYSLIKSITLNLKDEFSKQKIYSLNIGVSISYGFKELYGFIPFLSKKRDSWKRLSWGKHLAEFHEVIDPDHLKQLLEEAKQILDNFDESWLKDKRKYEK